MCLAGSFLLTLGSAALQKLGKVQAKEWLRSKEGRLFFFFYPLLKKLLGPKALEERREWDALSFFLSLSKQLYHTSYALFALFHFSAVRHIDLSSWPPFLSAAGGLVLLLLASDFFARLLGGRWSRISLRVSAFPVSLFLLLPFPLTALLALLSRLSGSGSGLQESGRVKDRQRLKEILRESELHHHLDAGDQKLIASFVGFKERVAKEIMVPRVDLFSLDATLSLAEASRLLAEQGYSRIPVYKETLDEIVGVVLYKDLLGVYARSGDLSAPLSDIAKPVLYTPENKRISQLLQEFRTKQIHMAIVVDEYGGTEGVVTIEDILEELVGEIEDESDIGEEHEYWEMPGGGWAIDPKITILDLEARLGIRIPEGPEYETVGGYVYHIAGTIPSKGWRLSHDLFELEVLSSNERAIRKLKIVPRKS